MRYPRYTAFHEAAHCVVARACEVPIVEVYLVPDGTGRTVNMRESMSSIEGSFRDTLVSLAGICGQRLVTKQSWFVEYLHGGKGDFEAAQAEVGHDDTWNVFLPLADKIVKRHGHAVAALAETLLEKKRLSGNQVERLLDKVSPELACSIESVRAMVPPGTPGYKASW